MPAIGCNVLQMATGQDANRMIRYNALGIKDARGGMYEQQRPRSLHCCRHTDCAASHGALHSHCCWFLNSHTTGELVAVLTVLTLGSLKGRLQLGGLPSSFEFAPGSLQRTHTHTHTLMPHRKRKLDNWRSLRPRRSPAGRRRERSSTAH